LYIISLNYLFCYDLLKKQTFCFNNHKLVLAASLVSIALLESCIELPAELQFMHKNKNISMFNLHCKADNTLLCLIYISLSIKLMPSHC